MTSVVKTITEQKLIAPPKYVHENLAYETIMGSQSYGVSSDDSDWDIYGFCIPNKELVFPHLQGNIEGFGRQIQKFEQFQQHHIHSMCGQKEYDVQIFNIVKFFQLAMDNNPNIVDSLFTPERCILHMNEVGTLVRENRSLFLHKGSWHKFKGYAYSQLSKIGAKANAANPKRQASILEFGYDVKFAYHVIRLLDECEQILATGTLDLEQNREQLKSIRRGEWTLEQIQQHFKNKEVQLETLYTTSTLQHSPDESALKALLMQCLEIEYGSLSEVIQKENRTAEMIAEIEATMKKYK
jgi:predicted nucleotidyltransferase